MPNNSGPGMGDRKQDQAQKDTVKKIAKKYNSVNEDIADEYHSMLEKYCKLYVCRQRSV